MIRLMVFALIFIIIICLSKEITHKQRHDNNNNNNNSSNNNSNMKFQAKRSNNNSSNLRGKYTQGLDTTKCKTGRCSECICPIDLSENCFKSYFKDMLFCKSTSCFCQFNSTTGVGYNGPGSSNCKTSLLCCINCNPSS